MDYKQRVTRNTPACIIVGVDQSGSMHGQMGDGTGVAKKETLARSLNKLILNLVQASYINQELRRYFDVAVIGYGGPYGSTAVPILGAGWNNSSLEVSGPLAAPQAAGEPVGIDLIANNPIREEILQVKASNGAGGTVTEDYQMPIWVEAAAANRTPMRDGLIVVKTIAERWAMAHPASLPPIVINITDGIFTDGDPSDAVKALKEIRTNFGSSLLFNLHLSSQPGPSAFLPSNVDGLADPYAKQLFDWSSELPPALLECALSKGRRVTQGARGFAFNADAVMLSELLDIGTDVQMGNDVP